MTATARGPVAWVQELRSRGDTVLTHQLVFATLFVVAIALVVPTSFPLAHPAALVLALTVEGAALIAAALASSGLGRWARWPTGAQDVLALASVLAILLLERSTEFTDDYLAVLVFVPVSSLAWTSGRRGVLLGTVASLALVVSPIFLVADRTNLDEWLVPSVLVPLVSLALGVFLAAAARRQRLRTAELEELSEGLRSSRDAMAGLMDAVTEQGIVSTDPSGLIETFNPGAEKLTGLRAAAMQGASILDIGLRREQDARADAAARPGEAPVTARWQAVIGDAASGGVQRGDWTIPHEQGESVIVRITVTRRAPLLDGAERGYLFVATDITEHVEAEHAKDQFIGYVSHELRTPISSVLGFLELIGLDDDNLTDEQRGHLEVVERNARRLLRLVEDLLLTAQVDAGRFAIVPEPVDLAEVVAVAVRAAAPNASEAGVELVDTTEGEVPADGDPTRLGQLVDNLVSNALKFTPREGTVTVAAARGRTASGGSAGVLTVSDTGIGIPLDEVDRLTERFFRASSATERRIPGVGLGLSISQAIAEAHGGTLVIASVPDEGTTFTVTLPTGAGDDAGTLSPR